MSELPPLPALGAPIGDGEIALREWRHSDAEQLAVACSDVEVQRWIPVPDPYTIEVARAWIGARESERLAGRELPFAITPAHDDERVLGSVGVVRPALTSRRIEIGYWVAPDARGRGVATRAVGALGDWAVRELGVARLEIIAAIENVASCAVALAAGFEQEAVLSRYLIDRAGVHDAAIFRLLR